MEDIHEFSILKSKFSFQNIFPKVEFLDKKWRLLEVGICHGKNNPVCTKMAAMWPRFVLGLCLRFPLYEVWPHTDEDWSFLLWSKAHLCLDSWFPKFVLSFPESPRKTGFLSRVEHLCWVALDFLPFLQCMRNTEV